MSGLQAKHCLQEVMTKQVDNGRSRNVAFSFLAVSFQKKAAKTEDNFYF
jgi:hypothetical protein